MTWSKALLIGCMWCAALTCTATEMDERAAIVESVTAAYEKSDFAAIETRYAEALATGSRTESGLYTANAVARALLEGERVKAGSGNKAHWAPVEQKVRRWAEAFPNSALPMLALSQAYVRHGFAYRGGGYAKTVTDEDWKTFHSYVRLAQEALLSRKDAGQKDPNWWAEMLYVAMLGSVPEQEYAQLATEALNAFPAQHDIYFEIAGKLMPRWGGSWEAISAFADEAVARTKATEGRALYGRIYWVVHEISDDPGFFQRPQVQWPKIRAGFEDIIKRYPSPMNLNYYTRMACEAKDKATAKRLFVKVRPDPVPEMWQSRGQFNNCSHWVDS